MGVDHGGHSSSGDGGADIDVIDSCTGVAADQTLCQSDDEAFDGDVSLSSGSEDDSALFASTPASGAGPGAGPGSGPDSSHPPPDVPAETLRQGALGPGPDRARPNPHAITLRHVQEAMCLLCEEGGQRQPLWRHEDGKSGVSGGAADPYAIAALVWAQLLLRQKQVGM
jgi:hypothetical protein